MEKVKEKNEAGESVKIKQIVGIEKIGAGWEMKKKMLGPKKLEPEKVKRVKCVGIKLTCLRFHERMIKPLRYAA